MAVFEVNTSLSTVTWKMDRYCPYDETSEYLKSVVCIGDVVYLRDPEAGAYLSVKQSGGVGGGEGSLSLAKFKKLTNTRGDEEEFDSAAYFVVEKEGADQAGPGGEGDRRQAGRGRAPLRGRRIDGSALI